MRRTRVFLFPVSAIALVLGAASEPAVASAESKNGIEYGLSIGYYEESDQQREDEGAERLSGLTISPRIGLQKEFGSIRYSAGYAGSYGDRNDSDYNFADHLLSAQVESRISKRLYLSSRLSLGESFSDEDLAQLGDQALNELLVFRSYGIGASFEYGAPQAKGRIAGGILFSGRSLVDSNIDNNSSVDYRLTSPGLEFSLRLNNATRATFGVVYTSYSYDDSALDRSLATAQVGLRFESTGKLSGSVKIGSAKSTFSDSSNPSVTNFAYSSQIVYSILDHSELSFGLNRTFDNRDGSNTNFSSFGSFSDVLNIAWKHDWSSRLSTSLRTSWESVSHECPESSQQQRSLGLNVGYNIFKSITLGGLIRQSLTTTDECEAVSDDLDNNRQIIGVYLSWTG